jgi:hypothetical protein
MLNCNSGHLSSGPPKITTYTECRRISTQHLHTRSESAHSWSPPGTKKSEVDHADAEGGATFSLEGLKPRLSSWSEHQSVSHSEMILR